LYLIEYRAMKYGTKAWPGESEEHRAARHEQGRGAVRQKLAVKRSKLPDESQTDFEDRTAERKAKEKANNQSKTDQNAQQKGETDEQFAKRERARKDAHNKGKREWTAKKNAKRDDETDEDYAKRERQRLDEHNREQKIWKTKREAQQEGESDEAFTKRFKERREKEAEIRARHEKKERDAATPKAGQQTLSGFVQPR
jgi:hypothetical protein